MSEADSPMLEEDFRAAIASLGDNAASTSLDWLSMTWQAPESFREGLAAYDMKSRRPPRKSRPGALYDFYFDLVYRHVASGADALRWYEDGRRWRSLTYGELHDRSTEREIEWKRAGVRLGNTVALLLDPGREYVVSLVTAMRMGLVISWLPAYGSRYLDRRLEALAPDFVFTNFEHLNRFRMNVPVLLPERRESKPDPGRPKSPTLRGDEPFARLFSPLDLTHDVPRVVTAKAIYFGLLRDLTFAFDLNPGDRLAAPGFDDLQWQPYLVLACLLGGATYVHLEPEQLASAPGLIAGLDLRILGVSPTVRDLYLRQPAVGLDCTSWFRDPQTQHEFELWRRFVEAQKLTETPMQNLLVDSARGEVQLQSIRRTGGIHSWVHPPPGSNWTLFEPGESGEPAAGTTGEFGLAAEGEEPEPTGILLSDHGREYSFVVPRHGSRDPVSAPGTLHALLVFAPDISPGDGVRAEFRARIRSDIRSLLGDCFVPDRIEVYSLYPHRQGDEIDHVWCANQYRMGMLAEKERMESYRVLTEMRRRFDAAPAPVVAAMEGN